MTRSLLPKTLLVARREFLSTVLTKGFIFGVLMTPLILLLVVMGVAFAQTLKGPSVEGTIAVVDETGAVAPHLTERFSAEGIKKETDRRKARAESILSEQARRMGMNTPSGKPGASPGLPTGLDQGGLIANAAAGAVQEKLEGIILEPMDQTRTLNVDVEKSKLADVDLNTRDKSHKPRLALIVLPANLLQTDLVEVTSAVPVPAVKSYTLYTANRLDPDILERLEARINAAIIDARVAQDPRAKLGGLTSDQLRQLLQEPLASVSTITAQGEKSSGGSLQTLLPMAFMGLLIMSAMTGGQYLLTSTIEEKSNRVMEVLLSAVSPMQLMGGKILGQMGVGLVTLTLYSGLGIVSLIAFSLQHLVTPMMMVYLIIFFFIAYFLIASLMASVGSAVSELREAQSLMGPVMVFLITPWLLWMPISKAPNSMLATIMSFVPGLNPFVMMIRLSSSQPPPTWQIIGAIIVGLLSAIISVYICAKIFRIGILLYGQAPNWRTLFKWIRMA